MRRLSLGFIAIFAVACLSFAGQTGAKASKGKTFTGEIMDSACAKQGSHEMMEKMEGVNNAKDCTLKCIAEGSKYVLYDSAAKTIYVLDDQTKPKEFAGQKVTVTGTFDKATKTIHVEKIEGAK